MNSIVRRLTPLECERLMGFPDNYLDIGGENGKPTPDSARYKACGNSWGVNCAAWVTKRIHDYDLAHGGTGIKTYATACSGVEAQSLAFKALGIDAKGVFFSEIEPFPCRVLATRYPDVPNLGDMTKIEVNGGTVTNGEASVKMDGGLDLFSGGTPCLEAGAMVLTETGYRPIETLRPGDMVVTHLGRLRKVVAIGAKDTETVELQAVSRPPMRITPDHKFWSATKRHVTHNNRVSIEECGWMEAQDNERGFVGMDVEYDIDMPTIPAFDKCDRLDAIELAGWYVGDGYVRRWIGKSKKAVILCFNDEKLAKFVCKFGNKIHAVKSKPDKNGVTKVTICNTALANWLVLNFGELAHSKTVPAWLVGADEDVRNAFVRGYLETDGCILPNGCMAFTTVSKSLAYGVADILRNACVYESETEPKDVICGRIVNRRKQYIVRKNPRNNRFHRHERWNFVRVRNIGNKQQNKTVYQISVEEDHSYVSNGIVSRNCQDFSVAGKRAGGERGSGTRSSLMWSYLHLVDGLRPRYIVWENVPGTLSSNGGRDFAQFAAEIAQCGYSVAYRTLDVQYTRVAGVRAGYGWCAGIGGGVGFGFDRAIQQRRRRIWLVGVRLERCAGADGGGGGLPPSAEILFEPAGLRGDSAPRREAGQGLAAGVEDCAGRTD